MRGPALCGRVDGRWGPDGSRWRSEQRAFLEKRVQHLPLSKRVFRIDLMSFDPLVGGVEARSWPLVGSPRSGSGSWQRRSHSQGPDGCRTVVDERNPRSAEDLPRAARRDGDPDGENSIADRVSQCKVFCGIRENLCSDQRAPPGFRQELGRLGASLSMVPIRGETAVGRPAPTALWSPLRHVCFARLSSRSLLSKENASRGSISAVLPSSRARCRTSVCGRSGGSRAGTPQPRRCQRTRGGASRLQSGRSASESRATSSQSSLV